MNETRIFARAIEMLDESERRDYILNSFDGDEAKAESVIRLVESHFASGDFMSQSPIGSAGQSFETANGMALEATHPKLSKDWIEKVGDQIGPYELVGEMGRGGMAVVYRARQKQPLQREVALKIIKPGLETQQIISRMEIERQALAMMSHRGIAKVFDAGVTDMGRPYYVMELVPGQKITDYCEQFDLSIRQRVELVSRIAEAVEHAHRKGIIHRDLKPSNILVIQQDDGPHAKIIDFGIAKIVSAETSPKETLTRSGQLVGTPQYMSPEQAAFDSSRVDTRTDIYSLGVVLYELLCGKAPFETGSITETLEQVANEPPVHPKRLNPQVDADLSQICLHSLNKEPEARYPSARELAKDLQRYLAGQPIHARPIGRIAKTVKWARRSPWLATLTAFSMAIFIGLIWVWASFTLELAKEKKFRRREFRTRSPGHLEVRHVDATPHAARIEQRPGFAKAGTANRD